MEQTGVSYQYVTISTSATMTGTKIIGIDTTGQHIDLASTVDCCGCIVSTSGYGAPWCFQPVNTLNCCVGCN